MGVERLRFAGGEPSRSARRRRASAFALHVIAGVLALACGGSGSSENETGASPPCQQGDTRTCVGVGACEGGQACGTDRYWGECVCASANGGSGGASRAGSGGNGDGAVGGSSGAPPVAGGSSGMAGNAGSGGLASSGGAAGTTGGGPPAECDVFNLYDCTGECPRAVQVSCPIACEGDGPSIDVLQAEELTVRVSLPPGPGSCVCAKGRFVIRIPLTGTDSIILAPMTATVEPPWALADASDCQTSYTSDTCQTIRFRQPSLLVWTSDPTAPAANVIFSNQKTCP
jgi:hypothetical protein